MKVLVCNVGSTSLKFKVYDMPAETVLATGGVEQHGGDNAGVRLYPNPTVGRVSLKATAEVERVDILDMAGRILKSIDGPASTVSFGDMPKGVYFVRVTTARGVSVEKVVKQ